MEHKSVKSDRGVIHYWMQGNFKECIVFTHGLTMDHNMFNEQMKYFGEKYKVISWDVPLHGESRPYENFNFRNVVDDLDLIFKTEGINSVHLVGLSMGGYIIQEYALTYPQKVVTITAIGTNPFGHEYYSRFERWAISNIALLAGWYPYKLLVKAIAKNSSKTEHTKKLALDTLSRMTKREIIYSMDTVYKELLKRKERNHFNVPVLIMYADSEIGNVKKHSNRWAKNENYLLKVISNAAHMSNMDNPEEFNRILDEFLKKHRIILHITEDTRFRFAPPKLPSLRYGNFLYPRNVT
ncbi:MAG: alpha/beta fold hydrolase, partial [Dehalococcoidia bacterium]